MVSWSQNSEYLILLLWGFVIALFAADITGGFAFGPGTKARDLLDLKALQAREIRHHFGLLCAIYFYIRTGLKLMEELPEPMMRRFIAYNNFIDLLRGRAANSQPVVFISNIKKFFE